MAAHGLAGIFWALNELVTHGIADDVTPERERRNAVAGLFVAGKALTKEITDSF